MPTLSHHFCTFVEGGAVLLCKEDVIFFLQAKLAILLSFAVRWCAGQDFPCDVRLWSQTPVPNVLRQSGVMPLVLFYKAPGVCIEPGFEQNGAPHVLSLFVPVAHSGLVHHVFLQAFTLERSFWFLLAAAGFSGFFLGVLSQQLLVVRIKHCFHITRSAV